MTHAAHLAAASSRAQRAGAGAPPKEFLLEPLCLWGFQGIGDGNRTAVLLYRLFCAPKSSKNIFLSQEFSACYRVYPYITAIKSASCHVIVADILAIQTIHTSKLSFLHQNKSFWFNSLRISSRITATALVSPPIFLARVNWSARASTMFSFGE